MNTRKFALGLRFDTVDGATPELLWREVFSILTTGDAKGLAVYGGYDGDCYVCALAEGKLTRMRYVYKKLSEDASLNERLNKDKPYIQTNALLKIDSLVYYGKITKDGEIEGGREVFFNVRLDRIRRRRLKMRM